MGVNMETARFFKQDFEVRINKILYCVSGVLYEVNLITWFNFALLILGKWLNGQRLSFLELGQ